MYIPIKKDKNLINMASAMVQSDFESYHEFKLPSEVDPRKKNGKGGFLEGEIQLPMDIPKMKVTISTHPTFRLSSDKYPGVVHPLEEFSPCLIYPFHKPEGRCLWDKMSIPNVQHWKVELLIKDNTVFIKKNISELDHTKRETFEEPQDWEELFKIGQDWKLCLGKDSDKLKVKILYPKTEARSTEEDVTVLKMLKQRGFPQVQELATKFCEGPNKKNLKECKLLVDIQAPTEGDTWVSIRRGLSRTIKDSKSLLDIHDLSANVSCSEGGSKIFMVSESSLSKDVIPEFQLWSKETGQRIEEKEEEGLLNNKIDNRRVQNGWLRFISPPQPKLEEILSRGYMFKLVARRTLDGAVSNAFDFSYTQHDTCLFTPKPKEDPDLLTCRDCHHSKGNRIPESIKAKPGVRKRKPVEEEGSQRLEEKEKESDNNSGRKVPKMMSPDSGVGDSPPGARRDSNDSIYDPPFQNILTEGSGPGVEELETNLPADGYIGMDLEAEEPESEKSLIDLIASYDHEDVQLDGTPKSSQSSASADNDKPKASRRKDNQPEARQGVLRATLTTIKTHVLAFLILIMSMLLKLAGEPTLEREPGKVFTELISVYWPFPIILALLCFFDWTSDIFSGQIPVVWVLIAFLAVLLTVISLIVMTALKRLFSRDR